MGRCRHDDRVPVYSAGDEVSVVGPSGQLLFHAPRRTDTERIPVGLYHQGFRVFRLAVLSRGACEGRDGDLVVSRGVA